MSTVINNEKEAISRIKWTVLFTALSILTSSCISYFKISPTPVIQISSGPIQGRVTVSRNGTEYWEFLGIPYSEPPIGNLRFQPPVPVKPWQKVKQVVEHPPPCTQFDMIARKKLFGEENCLYLDVATQPFTNNSKHLRPVMVNFPGGGFVFGQSSFYSPRYLLDHDVVIVTIQYRLGPQGFLNFAQSKEENDLVDLPRGNMGLKDQLLALKWVHENIAYFGGNPNQITLYGQSAGGVSVHYHMLHPQSRNLFHRAILHSGNGFSYWAFDKNPRKRAINLVKKLGCPVENPQKLLECLKTADPYALAINTECAQDPTIEPDIIVPSKETVSSQDSFLTAVPYDLLKTTKDLPQIPIIFGMNSGDGALRTGIFDLKPEFVGKVQANWITNLGWLASFDKFSEKAAEQVKAFYFPDNESFADPQNFKNKVAELTADFSINDGVHTSAKLHSKGNSSTAPVYLHVFDYHPVLLPGNYGMFKAVALDSWLHSEISLLYTMFKDWIVEKVLGTGKGAFQYGAAHAQDLFFLWPIEPALSWMFSRRDLEVSRNYSKLIVDFVKGSNQLTFGGVSWSPVNGVDGETQPFPYFLLDKNGQGRVVPEPFAHRVRFWQSLGTPYLSEKTED